MSLEITKDTALEMLGDVGEENRYFYCCDGRVLRNLYELEEFLRYCEAPDFWYHMNGRNDFANWVRDVINDHRLSGDILSCRDKLLMAEYVGARIDFLEKRAGLDAGIVKAVKRRLMKRKGRGRRARRRC